jgi:hypothetical protein
VSASRQRQHHSGNPTHVPLSVSRGGWDPTRRAGAFPVSSWRPTRSPPARGQSRPRRPAVVCRGPRDGGSDDAAAVAPATPARRPVEALFERPSYQDLFVTPIGGALVGLALEPIRSWIKLKPEPRWYDQLFLAATDPIGMLNGMFEKLLGIKSDLRVDLGQGNRVYVQLRMNWN